MEQQIPDRIAIGQPFEDRLQLRADTGQFVDRLEKRKESFVTHGKRDNIESVAGFN